MQLSTYKDKPVVQTSVLLRQIFSFTPLYCQCQGEDLALLFLVFFCLFTCLLFCPLYFLCFSGLQHLGDHWPGRWGPLCAEDIPTPSGAEAGAFHAGAAPPACGADEDYGQRSHLLHAPHALHLHIQVNRQSAPSVLEWHSVGHGDSSFRAWLHNSSCPLVQGKAALTNIYFFIRAELVPALNWIQQLRILAWMGWWNTASKCRHWAYVLLQDRWSLLLFSTIYSSVWRLILVEEQQEATEKVCLCMPWMPW